MVYNKLKGKGKKMVNLKLAIEKLQRSLQLGNTHKRLALGIDEEAYVDDSSSVPEDVKEGHFAVVAMDDNDGSAKRFVVPLKYLTHPMFQALLERAAEKYGFDNRGALTIPRHPSEMERILAERWDGDKGFRIKGKGCRLSSNPMLVSY